MLSKLKWVVGLNVAALTDDDHSSGEPKDAATCENAQIFWQTVEQRQIIDWEFMFIYNINIYSAWFKSHAYMPLFDDDFKRAVKRLNFDGLRF